MQAHISQLSVWTVLFSVTAINDCALHLCDTPARIASLNCFHCCRFTVFVLAPEQWRYSPPVPTWSVLLKSWKRWGGVSKRFSFKSTAFQKGFYSCITFISALKRKVWTWVAVAVFFNNRSYWPGCRVQPKRWSSLWCSSSQKRLSKPCRCPMGPRLIAASRWKSSRWETLCTWSLLQDWLWSANVKSVF